MYTWEDIQNITLLKIIKQHHIMFDELSHDLQDLLRNTLLGNKQLFLEGNLTMEDIAIVDLMKQDITSKSANNMYVIYSYFLHYSVPDCNKNYMQKFKEYSVHLQQFKIKPKKYLFGLIELLLSKEDQEYNDNIDWFEKYSNQS